MVNVCRGRRAAASAYMHKGYDAFSIQNAQGAGTSGDHAASITVPCCHSNRGIPNSPQVTYPISASTPHLPPSRREGG